MATRRAIQEAQSHHVEIEERQERLSWQAVCEALQGSSTHRRITGGNLAKVEGSAGVLSQELASPTMLIAPWTEIFVVCTGSCW